MAVVYTPKEKRNIIIRIVLVVAVLLVAGFLLVFGLSKMKTKPGFAEITADYSNISYASYSYKLSYYVDDTDGSISKTQTNLTKLYSETIDKAYQLTDSSNDYTDVYNIKYINQNPNTDIELDENLYNLLEEISNYDSNLLYIGGIYEYWDSVLYKSSSKEQELLDPLNNEANKKMIDDYISSYSGNISLNFLGNNKINLYVSDSYTKAYEDAPYIGINLFKEAFIMDYVRDVFYKAGYRNGYMISDNGFVVNFGMSSDNVVKISQLSNYYGTEGNAYNMSSYQVTGQSYINYLGFKYSTSAPVYSITFNDETIYRTRYVNPSTGYPDFGSESLLIYKNDTLVNTLISLYDYFIQNNKSDISYIDLGYDGIIHTNVSDYTCTRYEVVYD
ncbi:MAG: hypothetical protein K6A63_05440 [Acholeplasmatales bacterium]|nr:hypothetical protein [Acholeplasmatales bacterium]